MPLKITRTSRAPKFMSDLSAAKAADLDDLAASVLNEAASNSRVRTGSYRNGWYLWTPLRDSYQQAVSAAEAVNPEVHIVPPVTVSVRGNTAVVGNVVEHAVFVEDGTARGLPGDHTLLNAMVAIEAQFGERALKNIRAVLADTSAGAAASGQTRSVESSQFVAIGGTPLG